MIRARRDTTALGTIRFVDKHVPPLAPGQYTLTASPQLKWTDDGRKYPNASARIRVDGPRFSLPEGDVESFFPPSTDGAFDESLPNIAFFEPGLPWERDLGDGITRQTHPWFALLLFTEDEIEPPDGSIGPDDAQDPTKRGRFKVSSVVTPPAGTLGPQGLNCTADELAGECFAIDIKQETFAAIVPFKDDLPYLTHCRKIDVSGKITPILGDGWFSVVVANRFPPSPGTKPRHIVHLVSLEGFGKYLDPARTWPPGSDIRKVRMVSLCSWRYECRPAANDFDALARKLVANATAGGEELRLRAPKPEPRGNDADDPVARAIERGYMPLGYDTRSGESSFAWFHGPLVPQPIRKFTIDWPPVTANAALIYDETTGTFDVSYAAAWQLGRLIALSNRIYSGDTARLRVRLRRTVTRIYEHGLQSALEPPQEKKSLVDWLTGSLPEILSTDPATLGEHEPLILKAAPADCVAATQKLLADAQVQSAMTRVAALAIQSEPMSRIPEWESRLRLLRDIPFAHLVPDKSMLPVDSIRFFYIDNNWIDALIGGARSVGVDSTRTMKELALCHDCLHDASHGVALEHRASLLGVEPPARNENGGGPAVTGFLLRSALVSGWTGLEIEGYKKGVAQKINLVRNDSFGDVMLVLFDDRVDRVTIAEPKEGLAFGMRKWMFTMRRVTGNVAEYVGRKELTPQFRRASNAIKVNEWQDALRNDPTLNPSLWGPAAFALQMIRAPLKITFYNPLMPTESKP